jgi:predicted nicotinamide N-methyase
MLGPELERLVAEQTLPSRLPLCPELVVRQASALVTLWESIEEIGGTPSEPPFWACSWPGSQAIARYVLDHPETVRGRFVLDLGCGNGLAAIASARAGARRVVAGDVDPVALWMTRWNAEANGVQLDCSFGDLLETAPPVPPVDRVLVGDLFYARAIAERAAPWIESAAFAGADVIVGDPGRSFLPSTGLEVLATYEVAVSEDVESVPTMTTRVYRLAPLPTSSSR